MEPACTKCHEITGLESRLDERANALTEKVIEFCRPVRERNNERWRQFERECNRRVIGRLIYEGFREPKGIEDEPSYSFQEWFRPEAFSIEGEAHQLERLKEGDMEHWGDELVEPYLPMDPAGYYTPKGMITRRQCYDDKFCADSIRSLTGENPNPRDVYYPSLPVKYDFLSVAGAKKVWAGKLVLDNRTLKVVPETECDWRWADKLPRGDFSSSLARWLYTHFRRCSSVFTHRQPTAL